MLAVGLSPDYRLRPSCQEVRQMALVLLAAVGFEDVLSAESGRLVSLCCECATPLFASVLSVCTRCVNMSREQANFS